MKISRCLDCLGILPVFRQQPPRPGVPVTTVIFAARLRTALPPPRCNQFRRRIFLSRLPRRFAAGRPGPPIGNRGFGDPASNLTIDCRSIISRSAEKRDNCDVALDFPRPRLHTRIFAKGDFIAFECFLLNGYNRN